MLLLLRRLLLLALSSLLLISLGLDGAQKVQHSKSTGRQPKLCSRTRVQEIVSFGQSAICHRMQRSLWLCAKAARGCWMLDARGTQQSVEQVRSARRTTVAAQPTWLVSSWPVMSACENRSSWWRNCGVDTSSRIAAALLQPAGHKHTFSEQ